MAAAVQVCSWNLLHHQLRHLVGLAACDLSSSVESVGGLVRSSSSWFTFFTLHYFPEGQTYVLHVLLFSSRVFHTITPGVSGANVSASGPHAPLSKDLAAREAKKGWVISKIVSIISLVMRCIFNFQDQISSNFFSVQSSCKSLKKWLQLESESRWLESTSLLLAIQSPVCMFTICCENIKDETQSPLAVHSAVPPLKSIWSSSLWSLSDSDICVHHPRQSHKLLPQSHSC